MRVALYSEHERQQAAAAAATAATGSWSISGALDSESDDDRVVDAAAVAAEQPDYGSASEEDDEDEFTFDLDARRSALLARPAWSTWASSHEEVDDEDDPFVPGSETETESDDEDDEDDWDDEDGDDDDGGGGGGGQAREREHWVSCVIWSLGGVLFSPLWVLAATFGRKEFPLSCTTVWAYLAKSVLSLVGLLLPLWMLASLWKQHHAALDARSPLDVGVSLAAAALAAWVLTHFRAPVVHKLFVLVFLSFNVAFVLESWGPRTAQRVFPHQVAAGVATEVHVQVGPAYNVWREEYATVAWRMGLPRPPYWPLNQLIELQAGLTGGESDALEGHVGFAPTAAAEMDCSTSEYAVRHVGTLQAGKATVALPEGVYVTCYRPHSGEEFWCRGGALVVSK